MHASSGKIGDTQVVAVNLLVSPFWGWVSFWFVSKHPKRCPQFLEACHSTRSCLESMLPHWGHAESSRECSRTLTTSGCFLFGIPRFIWVHPCLETTPLWNPLWFPSQTNQKRVPSRKDTPIPKTKKVSLLRTSKRFGQDPVLSERWGYALPF